MAINPSALNDSWTRFRRAASREWTDFERWIANSTRTTANRVGEAWRHWRCAPRLDLFETNEAVELRVDLPGVDAEAIDIKVRGRRLTIRAQRPADLAAEWTCRVHERAAGQFTRSVTLPCAVRDDPVNAHYRDGVLAVSLPKKSDETQVQIHRD